MRLTPTKLKELCEQYDLSPSKKYGQNFLIQEHPIKKMFEAAEINKNDLVVEIGPGFGILTFALAEKAKKVIAFEIEKKIENYWQENKPENVEIIWGNALMSLRGSRFASADEAIPSLVKSAKGLPHLARAGFAMPGYKVIANVPYQITSDLIRTLLELENKPESITIMVQKEVAERICAQAGEMSLLAISVQYYGEVKTVAIVTRGNFWPEPKVDSAILHIKVRQQPPCSPFIKGETNKPCLIPPLVKGGRGDIDQEQFFKIVKTGFSQKRKQLWSNLSKGLKIEGEMVKKVLLEVVGNDKVRAEELGVEEWKEITTRLSTTSKEKLL